MQYEKLIKSLLNKILLEIATDEEINLYLRLTTINFYAENS